MASSRTGSWDRVREIFADQFEADGSSFIYRKSQKGEAIRVTAEERSRFVDEFNGHLRYATWILYAGLALVLGGILLFTILAHSEVSQLAIFAGIAVVMAPYWAYYQWAWAAPARELSGRTPIARERSPEEVRRLRFLRITYGQLASVAFGGLAMPFLGSSRADVFSGWNRLWLVFGAALVLLAVIQAFRKWRFGQEDSYSNIIPSFSDQSTTGVADDRGSQIGNQLWRYLPFATILLVIAFLAFSPGGKEWAGTPTFWSIALLGIGGWALFTVVRGFTNGQIEPFVRGVYNTYDRGAQPKRFWASMVWNGFLGCLCLWGAFQTNAQLARTAVQDRCYNAEHKYKPEDAVSACDQLFAGKAADGWDRADVFLYRGIAYNKLGRPLLAIADYSAAIRLRPNFFEAYYDRALADLKARDFPHALTDFGSAIRLRPKDGDSYFSRGLVYLDERSFDDAIADFTRAHELEPKNEWPLANRGLAYVWKNDNTRAEQDFAAVRAIDAANPVLLHGEGLMHMWQGDLEGAVDRFTAALSRNPADAWALQMRADAYQQMGNFTQARSDRARLRQLVEPSKSDAQSH